MSSATCTARCRRARGYSLVELLVSLVVLMAILLALLEIFDSSTRIARVQADISQLQQSMRTAQESVVTAARRAGTGGLPLTWVREPVAGYLDAAYGPATFGTMPNGLALSVQNNVSLGGGGDELFIPETAPIGGEDDTRHRVLPGSDVLTVRGVYSTPVYYLQTPIEVASQMVVSVPDRVFSRVRPLQPLIDRVGEALDAERPMAFILRDLANPDAFIVMPLDPATTSLTPNQGAACRTEEVTGHQSLGNSNEAACIQIGLRWDPANVEIAEAFGHLSMGNTLGAYEGVPRFDLPGSAQADDVPVPATIGSIGILEEYRYYVRANWEELTAPPRLMPIFSRAEFVPGTDILVDRFDIAENIIGMQVALAFQSNATPDALYPADALRSVPLDLANNEDEILFNAAGDLAAGAPGFDDWTDPIGLRLDFLRLTLVGWGNRIDNQQSPPTFGDIEDTSMNATLNIGGRSWNFNDHPEFRRRLLQTTIDMRNLQ
ncbi:MAG: prepilin-type N-terminal cleavage/methylation domain-containing protein [Acidobacteriota bacterium]